MTTLLVYICVGGGVQAPFDKQETPVMSFFFLFQASISQCMSVSVMFVQNIDPIKDGVPLKCSQFHVNASLIKAVTDVVLRPSINGFIGL